MSNIKLPKQIKSILFVCTGNSCRSVMAENLCRKFVREQAKDIRIDSAGTMQGGGLSASPETQIVLKRDDIDASQHVSKGLTEELLINTDLICAMTRGHQKFIADYLPRHIDKTILLSDFYKGEDAKALVDGIPDPIGMSQVFYDRVYDVIRDSLSNLLDDIGKKE